MSGAQKVQGENAAPKECTWCSATENLLRCSGCRQKWFCDNDKKCLRQAWTKGGHKEECKALREKPVHTPVGLPAALRTVPSWTRAPTSGGTGKGGGPMVSGSYDQQPLDEDDECSICLGDPMSRSGQGICALKCSHRFHRDCVEALRCRLVESPCPTCDPDSPAPPWEDAVRRYVRVCCHVQQGRVSWDSLGEDQQEDVEEVTVQLEAAAAQGDTAAQDTLATLQLPC